VQPSLDGLKHPVSRTKVAGVRKYQQNNAIQLNPFVQKELQSMLLKSQTQVNQTNVLEVTHV
jgi:hypothetical protein